MKKQLAFILAIAMTTSLCSSTVYAKEKDHGYLYNLIYGQSKGSVKPNDNNVKISWDKKWHNPRFIIGSLSKNKVTNSSDALKYLKSNMDAFDLTHGDFKLISEDEDNLGYGHYKFQYIVDDLDVSGSQVIVHTNNSGIVYSVNGQLLSSIPKKGYSKDVKLSLDEAKSKAEQKLEKSFNQCEDKIYLYNDNNTWVPAYQLRLWNDDELETWMAVINATNGNVIKAHEESYDEAATGKGIRGDIKQLEATKRNGTYYLENTSNTGKISTYDAKNGKTLPGTIISSPTNTFNESVQAAGVDAHYYVDQTYKYYKNVHGRDSYDGKGGSLNVTVHYGKNYLNAYFNRRDAFVFGDGDNKYAKDFAKALDIIAHEFTHGVTQHSANLAYENQSGALNESFSDVFGILVENRDWTMGEDIVLPNAPIKLMRSMEDPTLYDQPAHMKDYKNLPNTQDGDWGGVHTNSGIPNKAFYNVAQAIGREKSGQIYYRALTKYLHEDSNFQDARDALERSAQDLYGNTEKLAVSKAFYAVGIGAAPQDDNNVSLKAATISVDKETNNGNYTLTINLDNKNSAKNVKVTENGRTEVLNQAVNVETTAKTLTKSFTNKPEGKYTYVVEVSDNNNNTATSQIDVTVVKDNVLELKAARVSVDNPTNNGKYTLTIALDKENSAKNVRVIENGRTEVLNQAVNVETSAKTLTKSFTNKPEGKYSYVVEVSDDNNNTATSQIDVTVVKDNVLELKAAKVSVDNPTNNGKYTLTIALDKENSAKNVRVIENGKTEVLNQAINVETNAKTLTKSFTNKPEGQYTYVVEVSDDNNTVTSEITVTVQKNTQTVKAWEAYTRYYVGDLVDYEGVTFKCIRSHFSLASDNPNTLKRYWQKVN